MGAPRCGPLRVRGRACQTRREDDDHAPRLTLLRIEGSGPHAVLLSTLCAACPQGFTGCCAGPPEYDWSDVGRVVAAGGKGFLLACLAEGKIVPSPRGLLLRRVRTRSAGTQRRRLRCVHHGERGCTIPQSFRPATCNYYLCDDAFADGEREAPGSSLACRRAHGWLRATYEGWDRTLAAEVQEQWPEGPGWDGPFLDWLGARFGELEKQRSAGVPEPPW